MFRLFVALGLAFFLSSFATAHSDSGSCSASPCKCRDGEKQNDALSIPCNIPFSAFVFGLTAIFSSSFQVETVEMASQVREVTI